MKISDLEKLTGLKRSNIFYYEREGLLTPRREDNSYREYSEDDLRRLKTVVVLRKLGFTVAEIRALLDGERTLPEVLPENMARLSEQEAELNEAMALCRDMERQALTMDAFDPDAWFELVTEREREGRGFLDILGDAADDVTGALAFVQDSIGFNGPVWALFFLSEEGIKKRRLWKLYWISLALGYLWRLALPYLFPGDYMRMAAPWAALVFTVVQGVVGSLVLIFCARHIIPGQKPRRALALTAALVVGVNLCLGVVGQQVYRVEIDEDARSFWTSSVRQGNYSGDDPEGYVRDFYRGTAELDTWQSAQLMVIFTSRGPYFQFYETSPGVWTEFIVTQPVDGTLYTVDPYGLRKYPSRLMLTDGTVVEPIYEAHFATGYVPLYAFDVSKGQTYIGIEYGVDGAGIPHYEIDAASYGGASDWTPPINGNERKYAHSVWEILGQPRGAELLSAYRDFRAAVWRTEPIYVSQNASLGVDSTYALYAEYLAPPALIVHGDDGAYVKDEWGLVSFDEALFFGDKGPYLQWTMTAQANVTPLLAAEEITPELLQTAALSVQSDLTDPDGGSLMGAYDLLTGDWLPYKAARYWSVAVPDALSDPAQAVFTALNG